MAHVVILGPSQWKSEGSRGPSPLEARRRIQYTLNGAGHRAVLLEDRPGMLPPLQDKFERLLEEEKITDVLVYWPRSAKTATLQQELVILYGKHPYLRVWVLYEQGILKVEEGCWIVAEGERGRYTNDLLNAAFHLASWADEHGLDQQVRLFASDLNVL